MSCYTRHKQLKNNKIHYTYKNKNNNKTITDTNIIQKLNDIKIPHTYSNVVLCPDNKRSIGVGYDGTNTKQYFYNKKHIEKSNMVKNCSLIHLCNYIPSILKDIDKYLKQPNIDHNTLNSLALKIMMLCNFRVGNTKYFKRNNTHGLTTILMKHIKYNTNEIILSFIGKKKQLNECKLIDKICINLLKKITINKHKNDVIFSYEDFIVTPSSLNQFLSIYHPDITTKTWRTWIANIQYLTYLFEHMKLNGNEDTEKDRKKISNDIIKISSDELHIQLFIIG